MKQEEIYVGIDVAKARVDVAIRPGGDIWSIDYDEPAVSELVSRLLAVEPTAVLLEATGGLEVPLVSALAAAALPVVVVNPRQVRDFARATGKLAKTDALDAQVLAHFAEAVRPPVRSLRDEDTPGAQLPYDATQPANDDACCGEESPETSFPLCKSQHPVPYHLAGAGAERSGQGPAKDST